MPVEIALLISHYNDLTNLKRAIASVKEEFPVHLYVVDDGSKIEQRPTQAELDEQFQSSGKVILIQLPQNVGSENVRNEGLKIILKEDYKYVAILDSDDQNYPNRLRTQRDFLVANPSIGLVGSWIECVDAQGNFLHIEKRIGGKDKVRKWMHVNSMIAHPSFFVRTSVLKEVGMYRSDYPTSEDFDLLFRILKNYDLDNVQEVLVKYTIHPNSISSSKRKIQLNSRMRILMHNFHWGIFPIYGLIRNIPLMFMSRDFSLKIKKAIGKN